MNFLEKKTMAYKVFFAILFIAIPSFFIVDSSLQSLNNATKNALTNVKNYWNFSFVEAGDLLAPDDEKVMNEPNGPKMKEANIGSEKSNLLLSLFITLTFLFICLGWYLMLVLFRKKRALEKSIAENIHLRKEVEVLSRCNASKDRFFAIMAHDLRSPFNNLLQGLELLKMEYRQLTDKERWTFLFSLSKESHKIAQFLEHLLTWGKSQRGRIVVHWESLWMWHLADEILEFYRPSARKKNIILINRIPRHVVALGDRNLAETVLRNLISNALKFTTKGGQIILNGSHENGKITIGVCDNGIGISTEHREHIFELGQRHSKGTEGEEGTGLGLVVCRELMEKMEGGIRVEANPGGGTTFYFSLKKGEIPHPQSMKKQSIK